MGLQRHSDWSIGMCAGWYRVMVCSRWWPTVRLTGKRAMEGPEDWAGEWGFSGLLVAKWKSTHLYVAFKVWHSLLPQHVNKGVGQWCLWHPCIYIGLPLHAVVTVEWQSLEQEAGPWQLDAYGWVEAAKYQDHHFLFTTLPPPTASSGIPHLLQHKGASSYKGKDVTGITATPSCLHNVASGECQSGSAASRYRWVLLWRFPTYSLQWQIVRFNLGPNSWPVQELWTNPAYVPLSLLFYKYIVPYVAKCDVLNVLTPFHKIQH